MKLTKQQKILNFNHSTLLLLTLLSLIVTACTQEKGVVVPTAAPEKNQAINPQVSEETGQAGATDREQYDPRIVPNEFSPDIDNLYFSMVPGKKMIYEGRTEDGLEKIEINVLDETKRINGIDARIVWDRVWLDGELIEETYDWYAQDLEGNVWYLGEDSKEMLDGKIVSTHGSWQYGMNGALPGIIMKANPRVGETYLQEYYVGEAEDKADILSLSKKISVPFGSFEGCVQTLDYTALEPDVREHKYYCRQVGGVALEVDLEGGERVELVSVEYGTAPSPVDGVPGPIETTISEEEAKKLALDAIPGRVTDIAVERKYGEPTFVVEIDADNGPQTDVIISLETGEILGIES